MATSKGITPVEILQKFYAAEPLFMATPPESPDAITNMNAMAAYFAPDLKMYQPKDLPWGGIWEGTEGFLAWGEVMTGFFDKLEVEPIRMFDDGKETVVVESIVHVRIREIKEEHDLRLVQIANLHMEKVVIKDIRQYPFEIKELLARLGKY